MNPALRESETDSTLGRKIRVLMVEDDIAYQTFIRYLLQNRDFEFAGVRSLEACLSFLESEVVDVITVDLNLPDSRGFETFIKVAAAARGTPILILTGMNEENHGLLAVSHGAQDFLVKDMISDDALIRVIKYAYERKRFEESTARLATFQDFTTTLAHDMRMPLISMNSAFSALLSEQFGPLTPQQMEIIKTLQESGQDQLNLVQKLLFLYQLSAETIVFAPTDLQNILRICISKIFESKNPPPNYFAPEYIPPVMADNESLLLMFTHLLDNAEKFGAKNSPVTIKVEVINSRVKIQIHNFGPPIPEEAREYIMGNLWHGIPGKKYVPRTGIGLFLSNRIAILHGYPLSYSSSLEGGTTWTVQLNTYQDHSKQEAE